VSTDQTVQTMPPAGSDAESGNLLDRLKEYVIDLKAEMRRVTWPSADQVKATTAVVIATVFAFSAYFFIVDLIMGSAITKLFAIFGVSQAK